MSNAGGFGAYGELAFGESASGPTTHSVSASFVGVATFSAQHTPDNYALSASVVGVATVTADLTLAGEILAASIVGVAIVTAGATNAIAAGASVVGVATVTADAGVVSLTTASVVGTASVTAQLTLTGGISASIQGVASAGAALHYENGNIAAKVIAARTELTAKPNVYRPLLNPPRANDLVNKTDPDKFRLTVNSSIVSLTLNSYFNLLDFTFDYDSKNITFSEIATPTIGSPTYNLEQSVKLEIDFGTGLTQYFQGAIRNRQHRGVNNAEEIIYQAVGVTDLANEVTCLNTNGRPEIAFTVGTTITSLSSEGTEVTTTFVKKLSEAIQDMFTIMSSPLTANSISTALDTLALSYLDQDLPETVIIQNQGWTSGINQLLSYAPGYKFWWDDPTQRWTFVNIADAPIVVTRVDSAQLESCIFDKNTNDRYTAIKLLSNRDDAIDDDILNKTNSLIRNTVELTQLWSTVLEYDWAIQNVTNEASGTLEDERWFVFRRYKIPNSITLWWPGTPVTVRQKVSYGEEGGDARYEIIKGKVNWRKKQVILRHPAISRGDPYIKGDARPAEAVELTYYPWQFVRKTVVTSINSDGTKVTTITTVDPATLLSSIRYPETGFEGTAYSEFGVQREYVAIVDKTEITTQNAQARLAAMKDVVIAGDLPFGGDPIEQFINLGVRTQVEHPTKTTGIQSTPAYVTRYSYQLGPRGRSKSNVSMTSDKSFIR